MKYKAIISDLDGTLLNGEHTISDYTKEVVKSVIDKGIKFYIATGRHHGDVFAIKKSLDLDTVLITSNGARVHDEKNQEIIAHNIPQDLSEKLINYKFQDGIHTNLYSGERWYAEKKAPWAEEFHSESGFTYTLDNFQNLKDKAITKFFYIHENPDVIQDLKDEMQQKFGDKLNVTLSLPQCLEIMDGNVSKGIAIKEVLRMDNITLEETIAFGDGLNDLEMLGIVGEGFIMKNGNRALKEALPKLEVIDSNIQDGVAKKIKEIFKV